jgi:DNA-binding PadR family transcriptional regulator
MRGLLEALLLDSIAREPKHGYALIRELEQVFGEPPNRNQVYPMLSRLEKEGYLKADRVEGRGKTRYVLTGKGLELLKAYRVRTPLFRERVGGLWWEEGGQPAARPPQAEAPAAPRHALEDRIVEAGEPPRAPPAVPAAPPGGHAAGRCTAEFVLRKQPGQRRLQLEVTDLDPSCGQCAGMVQALAEVLGQFP